MNAGFEAFALACPLIHNLNFINHIESGKMTQSGCNHCNECAVEKDRSGVRCIQNKQRSPFELLYLNIVYKKR